MLPLSLYQLIFVLCIGDEGWRLHPVWYLLILFSLLAVAFGSSSAIQTQAYKLMLFLFIKSFFIGCVIFHVGLALILFKLYFRHFKPGGILAVHASKRILNLKPVVC